MRKYELLENMLRRLGFFPKGGMSAYDGTNVYIIEATIFAGLKLTLLLFEKRFPSAFYLDGMFDICNRVEIKKLEMDWSSEERLSILCIDTGEQTFRFKSPIFLPPDDIMMFDEQIEAFTEDEEINWFDKVPEIDM